MESDEHVDEKEYTQWFWMAAKYFTELFNDGVMEWVGKWILITMQKHMCE